MKDDKKGDHMNRKDLIDALYPEYSAKDFFRKAISAYQNMNSGQQVNTMTSEKNIGSFMRALKASCTAEEVREAERHVKEAYNESIETGQRVLDGYIQIGVLVGPLEKYVGDLAS